MMPIGSKIQVVSSSTNKSGAKIRRGSLGYIAAVGRLQYISDNLPLIAPARIVFTRYGFEKQNRSEDKFVGLAMPAITDFDFIKNAKAYLDKSIKQTQDANDKLKQIFIKEGVRQKKFSIVAATIDNNAKDITQNLNELSSWVISILSSNILYGIFTPPPNSPRNKLLAVLENNLPFAKELIEKYQRDRDFLKKHLSSLVKQEPENCKRLIFNLRAITNLAMMEKLSNVYKNLNSTVGSTSTAIEDYCYLLNSGITPPKIRNMRGTDVRLTKWMDFYRSLTE